MEVHISHLMETLTGGKRKGPRRGLYSKLQKRWPAVKDDIDKLEDISKFNCKSRQTGSQLYNIAKEALDFGKLDLALGVFGRGDYRKLCELFVYFLGGDVPGFKFHQPGACHEARFMADGLYLLTLHLTKNITNIMKYGPKSSFFHLHLVCAMVF